MAGIIKNRPSRTTKKQRRMEEDEGAIQRNDPNTAIVNDDNNTTTLKQMISECISMETNSTWNHLESFIEKGIVETYLWPIFFSSTTNLHTTSSPEAEEEESLSTVAFAIARLIHRKYHISSSLFYSHSITVSEAAAGDDGHDAVDDDDEDEYKYDGPLAFIYDQTRDGENVTDSVVTYQTRFERFLYYLLTYFFQQNNYHSTQTKNHQTIVASTTTTTTTLHSSVQVQVTILSFLTTMIQAMEPISSSTTKTARISMITPALQKMTSIGLWTYMSNHIREFHLRSNTVFAQRYNQFTLSWNEKKKDNENDDCTTTTLMNFIPALTQLFLQRLQSLNQEKDDYEYQSKERNMNSQDGIARVIETSSSLKEEILLPFFHTTLQFLIDLLSIPLTRRYLRRYLLSIHLSVSCTCSTLYSSTSFPFQEEDGINNLSSSTSSLIQSRILFRQLVHHLQELEHFGLDDITGAPYSTKQMKSFFIERASILQKMIHRYYAQELPDLMYASVDMICSCSSGGGKGGREWKDNDTYQESSFLRKQLDQVVHWETVLLDLAHRLRIMDCQDSHPYMVQEKNDQRRREFVTQVLLYHHILQPSESQRLESLPLFPDETLLWNPHLVPPGHVSFVSPHVTTLALPKIHSQFLTFGDYLGRFFTLLRLESAYEIRLDLVDAIRRMKPTASSRHFSYQPNIHVPSHKPSFYNNLLNIPLISEERLEAISNHKAKTEFHGWARMGIELSTTAPFRIIKISPSKLGENIPSQVVGEFCWDLSRCSEGLRKEWDDISEMDNLFLIAVDATAMTNDNAPMIDEGTDEKVLLPDDEDITFPQRYGILAVRGCTVIEIRDDVGNILNSSAREQYEDIEATNKPVSKSHLRFLKVELDSAQYSADVSGRGSSIGAEVYSFLNVAIRRHGRENHFKAILETIRGLLVGAGSINKCIPPWLRPTILGYGDPTSVSYSSKQMTAYSMKTAGISPEKSELDFCDTFLDERHLRDSFPSFQVIIDGLVSSSLDSNSIKNYRLKIPSSNLHTPATIVAESYLRSTQSKGNSVRFTPVQIEAIRSGLSKGLTLIVGPPGTGKTDVAVQIIANLFHTFPSERTVIITHSNASLNDIFEKVVTRGDIDERYLLRLGSGEKDLQISPQFDFSKVGRVKHGLSRRMHLLDMVQLLSESLGVSGVSERGTDGSPSYTCETAEYFRTHHVEKLMWPFKCSMKSIENLSGTDYFELFPFKVFFGIDDHVYMNINDVKEKFDVIDAIFLELAEYRPLELLRSQKQRSDYLITQQARIVAMTCTYAAIMRANLVELGFRCDNLLIEEAGQMLDIETFIPLLLQSGNVDALSTSPHRLKRICLIGDHNQLPPVVKNNSLARYSRLDQSLFSRLIHQGVPTIQLDKQGRARPELARLYSWRYKNLGNLNFVTSDPQFKTANAGLAYTHQLIDCGDFMGKGESAPTAFFYQNVGEAEYAVAIFQYMVMIGYPPQKITLLTTYNGQKELLLDILSRRCGEGTPLAHVRPGTVSTVDQYQGQQNDYIILSLVRTRSVGHLKDIRRLIVAMSRARLGLYILCRERLFSSCRELKKCMNLLKVFPNKLILVAGEHYPTTRIDLEEIDDETKFVVDDVIQMGKLVYEMQNDLYA